MEAQFDISSSKGVCDTYRRTGLNGDPFHNSSPGIVHRDRPYVVAIVRLGGLALLLDHLDVFHGLRLADVALVVLEGISVLLLLKGNTGWL